MSKGILGIDRLTKKLNKLSEMKQLETTMSQVGEFVRDDARLKVPTNSGDLKRSMSYAVEIKGTTIQTEVFNSQEHALYVEMGTGPKGQANHEGISPKVNPKYRVDEWYIPVEDFPNYEEYGYKLLTINGKGFIRSMGQPAQPFLYPAFKDNKKQVKKLISDEMKRFIKKEVRK